MGWWIAWKEFVNFEKEEERDKEKEEEVYKPGMIECGELVDETKNGFHFLKHGLQPEVDFHAGLCVVCCVLCVVCCVLCVVW